MTWIGRKKIAFIPLHRPNAHPPDDPIPVDWPAEILRRVYYDPNAFPGLPDRSTHVHPYGLVGTGRRRGDGAADAGARPAGCAARRA